MNLSGGPTIARSGEVAAMSTVLSLRGPVSEFAKFLLDVAEKWQREWQRRRAFEADPDPSKPKFFITAAFPYPNSPLHLGHSRTYTITDVYARFKRMQGYNVLFPMGFHFTGTPILTMAEAIASGDRELIDLMVSVYDVPEHDLDKLKDPLSMARYFSEEAKKAMIEAGYSIDWRREFTTVDEEFKRFITWQFLRLREKGYIKQGTHPVGWCPVHSMPVGMHDTKGDAEPEIGEYTLILFRIEDEGAYLAAATLRPETVFGVTNMWVNPDTLYVKVRLGNKVVIVSERAAFKLRFQKDGVEVIGKLKGSELVGKVVVNPATGRRVPVLPAEFVDPDTATGVVMSVPAHAPYDYVALRELLESGKLSRIAPNVDASMLEPIPLIEVEGYSEVPARDVVEKHGIRSQRERNKLDEATKEVYSAEFRRGRMRRDLAKLLEFGVPAELKPYVEAPVVMDIAGKPVPEARERTKLWLEALGYADKMYEIMNRPVYCRCGTEIVVKVLKDQWFIDYGNSEWKESVLKAFESIRVVPPEIRQEFLKTVDWLHERAVARTRGLGTPLPWDKSWIIESLSDSTIYMAFYTVIHKIRKYGIHPSKLVPEFWDYVMLGKGDPEKLASKLGIPRDVLEDLRSEFDYWYPLDSRHSGRDLVPNHLTFFVYNHVALFPPDKWPKQIVVNGFVMLEGKKMSKSLRNILPLRRALRIYGPDTVRAAVLVSAELLQDADFSDAVARSVMTQLNKVVKHVENAVESTGDTERRETLADRWLDSRLAIHVKSVAQKLEELRIRAASIELLYEMEHDLEAYLDLRGGSIGPAYRRFVESWVKMLAPITPHIAEEMWQRLGHETLVSLEKWPEPPAYHPETIAAVYYLRLLIDDIKSIAKVIKTKPKKAIVVTAPRNWWRLFRAAAEFAGSREALRETIKAARELGLDAKRAQRVARRIVELVQRLDPEIVKDLLKVGELDEQRVLSQNADYIAAKAGLEEVVVLSMEEDARLHENLPDEARRKLEAVAPLRPAVILQ